MLQRLIDQVKKDCLLQGRGRKKWWADQLGIPPLTLSHWLSHRQFPAGTHALHIKSILDQMQLDQHMQDWENYLWNAYYQESIPSSEILGDLILGVLSKTNLTSRSLALMSLLTVKLNISFRTPDTAPLQNRLGWLIETTGRKAPFIPKRSEKMQFILAHSMNSTELKKYYGRFQTPLGKKWKIYDCPLGPIKKAFL